MTVKKIFRSTAAKLVAFLVVVGCVAGAVTQAEYGIMNMLRWSNDSELVYRLEDRFEDSQLVNGLVSTTVADLDYALHEGLDQETFDRRFSGANFIGDYYGRMGDRVLKNSDLTEEEAASSLFFAVAQADGTLYFSGDYMFMPLQYSYVDPSSGVYREEDVPENSVIYVRITEEQAAEYAAQWSAQRGALMGILRNLVVLCLLAVIAYICLLFVTGRTGEDEAVHLVTIDRLFIELNLLLLFGLPIAAGAFNIYVIFEGMQQRDMGGMWWFLLPSIILFIGAFALAVELSLSLVRNLKNRSFVQHSFILRACRWCWRTVKRLWFWLADLLRRGWHAIGRGGNSVWRKILKNYKTRNVLLIFLGYSVILSLLAMMFGLMIDYGEGVLVFILGVVWFAAAAWFLLSRINGFECVVEALRRLRGGELEYKLENMPAGVFSEMAEDINSLGDGMQTALQNEIRAERMKSELITNVSHDLKTPLTSILNYADLLCQEHLTPEEANDYAKIIHQKGLRLKNLTSDLFDISKVQSGAEQMECERLDACTLVRQALGEQDQSIVGGKLTLKVDIPEHEVPVWADGKKMSRVLENLIGNCVKYALAGTRVFVSVYEREETAVIEIKNTANYAMDFDASEITERFVRGDEARSTEGSGLGLAIAKSYVEACGGTLSVDVDGDLFKVRIQFPLYALRGGK
ncbi:HAMP domain-containing histidine kinase [Agathobaculum sp. NSJ-28]|uniref:histidine kinase n=2 Tax=Agathobaculum TaxID=2048137 RepID=A0A923LTL1_9FIRM|nr:MULTISPECIES: HAMP domain-containing sensor histidine kinase [Agathobaculum]MBC5724206.1 HAMP domain-containing histidine kinase [Agathobaculum faecis]MCU6787839.1 HAMP domain-containing histidine kinase [Agathobaculum ammoniilyticum]SCI47550.1 Alkaline phosphatase synthesis sensor protein phoR [uncultured Butyricicoccus sp.]